MTSAFPSSPCSFLPLPPLPPVRMRSSLDHSVSSVILFLCSLLVTLIYFRSMILPVCHSPTDCLFPTVSSPLFPPRPLDPPWSLCSTSLEKASGLPCLCHNVETLDIVFCALIWLMTSLWIDGCLRVFVAVRKHHDQKRVGWKRFDQLTLPYCS